MFLEIIKHLKNGGIFSFTTELIQEYDKTRMCKLYFKTCLKYIYRIIQKKPIKKNYYNQNKLVKKDYEIRNHKLNPVKKKNLKSI